LLSAGRGWIREAAQTAKRIKRIHRLEAGYRRFRDHVADSQGLKDQVGWHRLDWIRFDCRYVLFPHEQMAREAALCARRRHVARRGCGKRKDRPASRAHILEAIDPSLRDRFLSAGKGDLVGPSIGTRDSPSLSLKIRFYPRSKIPRSGNARKKA
jgi:hypothetical protein